VVVRYQDNPPLFHFWRLAEVNLKRFSFSINTFFHSLLFVLGFSLIFIIVWGGAATAIGQVLGAYKPVLSRVGGIVVLIFGFFTLKVINIPWLNYEKRGYWQPGKGGAAISSLMMGVFFAAGWTPCIGPTLGAILTLGMTQESSYQAMILSSGYAVGLAIPFLLIGLGMDHAVRLFGQVRKYVRTIEIISGSLLIVVGLLMVFDQMTLITLWALQHRLFIDLPISGTDIPTYAIAVLAGLLSFLSPCVLPLVPAYLGYLSGRAVSSQNIK
jgi:cytochrome c-type biogenesis protein